MFSICIGSAFLGFSIFGRGIVFFVTVIPSYFCFTRTWPQNSQPQRAHRNVARRLLFFTLHLPRRFASPPHFSQVKRRCCRSMSGLSGSQM